METLGAARLAKEIPAQRAVATIVPREEITAVLQDPDADPELYLRISDESDESNVIAMSWSRAELEQLLEQATGDQIVLTFDRDELAVALGDVEAHGMRERALVFAVAAAGALGTGVGIANAMPTGDEGGPAVTQVAPAADLRVTDETGEVTSPSMAGEMFTSGGLWFVVVWSLVLGIAFTLVYRSTVRHPGSRLSLAVQAWLCLNVFNLLRSGTGIVSPLLVFTTISTVVLVVSQLAASVIHGAAVAEDRPLVIGGEGAEARS